MRGDCSSAPISFGVSFGSLADIRPASRRLSRSQACEGLFPLFGRLCHALKKDRRSFYRHSFTGTVNLPPPGLSWPSSSLHGERIVGWIKFSPHHALERKRGSTWMICLHGEQPLIPVSIIVFIRGACIGPAHLRKRSDELAFASTSAWVISGHFAVQLLCPLYLHS